MKTHVFVDVDNTSPSGFIPVYQKMREQDDILGCECIGVSFEDEYTRLEGDKRVKLFRCTGSKNSSDTWLTMLASMAISEEPDLEKIAIFSSDRDFLPVIWLAAQKGLQVEVYKDFHLLCQNLHKDVAALHIEDRVRIFNCCTNKKDIAKQAGPAPKKETITKGMKEVVSKFFSAYPQEREITLTADGLSFTVPFSDKMPENVFFANLKVCGLPKSFRKKINNSKAMKSNKLTRKGKKFYFVA